jgi:hypothetical protein
LKISTEDNSKPPGFAILKLEKSTENLAICFDVAPKTWTAQRRNYAAPNPPDTIEAWRYSMKSGKNSSITKP